MCENCIYAEYDGLMEQYICTIDFIIDEDDFAKINYNKLNYNKNNNCPYYKIGNEYTIVHKQI